MDIAARIAAQNEQMQRERMSQSAGAGYAQFSHVDRSHGSRQFPAAAAQTRPLAGADRAEEMENELDRQIELQRAQRQQASGPCAPCTQTTSKAALGMIGSGQANVGPAYDAQPQAAPARTSPPTAVALAQQEQELARELQEQRSQARGPAPGTGARVGQENRANIRMMPPSVAGNPAPSTAGRRSRPVHFSHQMISRAESGGQMDSFLNPTDGIRGLMRRAGVEPKNHQREQKQLISQMASQRSAQTMAKEERAEEQKRKEALLRNRSRDRAQQVIASGAEPSRVTAGRRAAQRAASAEELGPAGGGKQHARGSVPNYLQRRKAEWAAEASAEAERREMEELCPPGLRLVGAEEKAAVLGTLATEQEKAQAALRALPFVIKTHATQKRKDQLEARLLEIDGAMAAYRKEKVLVPIDA